MEEKSHRQHTWIYLHVGSRDLEKKGQMGVEMWKRRDKVPGKVFHTGHQNVMDFRAVDW
jgi:hypothetical protein